MGGGGSRFANDAPSIAPLGLRSEPANTRVSIDVVDIPGVTPAFERRRDSQTNACLRSLQILLLLAERII
jgi:hypothetical protein